MPPADRATVRRRDPGHGRAGRLGSLVGQSFTYGLGGILARIAGVFLVPVYLAAAGTEALGTAELVTSAVVVSATVLRLGIVNAMTRFTLAERRGDWAPVVHSIFTFVLVGSTAGALAGLALRPQLAQLLGVSAAVAERAQRLPDRVRVEPRRAHRCLDRPAGRARCGPCR